ncbi:hypothetical protein L9F63_023994, partial [Diploptera punctata]
LVDFYVCLLSSCGLLLPLKPNHRNWILHAFLMSTFCLSSVTFLFVNIFFNHTKQFRPHLLKQLIQADIYSFLLLPSEY